MALHTTHNVQRGLHRLLKAPQDVPTKHAVPWRDPYPSQHHATARHRALFAEYKELLADALGIAADRWEGRIDTAMGRGATQAAAITETYQRFFAGPAACSELVWTLRTFWLRCVALNRETPNEADRIPPQVLLLGWIHDEGHPEWVEILTAMPYWPIGLDEKGRWS
jgi:hypothetical protein